MNVYHAETIDWAESIRDLGLHSSLAKAIDHITSKAQAEWLLGEDIAITEREIDNPSHYKTVLRVTIIEKAGGYAAVEIKTR